MLRLHLPCGVLDFPFDIPLPALLASPLMPRSFGVGYSSKQSLVDCGIRQAPIRHNHLVINDAFLPPPFGSLLRGRGKRLISIRYVRRLSFGAFGDLVLILFGLGFIFCS